MQQSVIELKCWIDEFCKSHFDPHMVDERHTIPPNILMALGNKGLLGLLIPKEEGGLEFSTEEVFYIIEALARIDLSLAVMLSIHTATTQILKESLQTSTQKNVLKKVVEGRGLLSFALTEENTGSNAFDFETIAEENEDGSFTINGNKKWIGSAEWTQAFIVFAKTIDKKGKSIGISAFLVPNDAPGINYLAESLSTGLSSLQCSLMLNQVKVGREAILGSLGEGRKIALAGITFSRFGIVPLSLGIMKNAVQIASGYSSLRQLATGYLIENGIVLNKLLESTYYIEALTSLQEKIIKGIELKSEIPFAISSAIKVAAAEFTNIVIDHLIQIMGESGYEEKNITPRLMRDARVLRIFEGSTEALLASIGLSLWNQKDKVIAETRKFFESPSINLNIELKHINLSKFQFEEVYHNLGQCFIEWILSVSLEDGSPIAREFFKKRLNSQAAMVTKLTTKEEWEKKIQHLVSTLNNYPPVLIIPRRVAQSDFNPLLKKMIEAEETSSIQPEIVEKQKVIEHTHREHEVIDFIIEQIKKIIKNPSLTLPLDEPLANIGVDSLVAIDVIETIEKKYNINLPVAFLFDNSTLNEIGNKIVNDYLKQKKILTSPSQGHISQENLNKEDAISLSSFEIQGDVIKGTSEMISIHQPEESLYHAYHLNTLMVMNLMEQILAVYSKTLDIPFEKAMPTEIKITTARIITKLNDIHFTIKIRPESSSINFDFDIEEGSFYGTVKANLPFKMIDKVLSKENINNYLPVAVNKDTHVSMSPIELYPDRAEALASYHINLRHIETIHQQLNYLRFTALFKIISSLGSTYQEDSHKNRFFLTRNIHLKIKPDRIRSGNRAEHLEVTLKSKSLEENKLHFFVHLNIGDGLYEGECELLEFQEPAMI